MLELILALPILVIATFAIVEFALLMASQQRLEYAARMGALYASELDPLPGSDAAFAGSIIVDATRRNLEQAGIDPSDPNIHIMLEHNLPDSPSPLETGDLVCPDPILPPPPMNGTEYVRLTVCLDIIGAGMTPNLLRKFGFDLEGRVAQQTVTLRHER